MNPLILIIEDDKSLTKYLSDLLSENGYSVRVTPKGTEGIAIAEKINPSLIILDLNLPDMTGESVCAQIRKKNTKVPIIMLTAKTAVNERVEGLTVGADDYITKPFEAKELIARMKARLRSRGDTQYSLAKVEDLELDRRKIEVKRGGKVIGLTPHEFKLLDYLISNKGVVLTREMILNRVWSYSLDVESRVVDVYMGYLRKKIDGGFDKKLIHSVRGFGYTIKD